MGRGGPERIRVLKTLRPGAPGAKRLLDRFGEALVCVRYRVDPVSETRLTTVELILETTRPRRRSAERPDRVSRPDPIVELKVHYRETNVRAQIKQAGGRWRPDAGVWELPLGAARRFGLGNRIVRQRAVTAPEGTVDHGNR